MAENQNETKEKKDIVLAFDVYGTLLSTESIAEHLAAHVGHDNAATVAADWRRYQLEYTWRCNSMGTYEPFTTLTHKSLQHALALSSLTLPPSSLTTLLSSYNALSPFPDVPPQLSTLLSPTPSTTLNIHPVLFTNGTMEMVTTSLASSPLAPYTALFPPDRIITVEEVRKYKPCMDLYRHLCERVGKKGREGEVWVVSGNAFDVVGARKAGLGAVWVDRGGKGWVDSLEGEGGRPSAIVGGLGEVVKAVEGVLEGESG